MPITNDRELLHNQLIRLGDMMGDGLHHEPDGKWISREYKKTMKVLYPECFKKDHTKRDETVAKWCTEHKCSQCGGILSQTRKGSLRVQCAGCKSKFQLTRK